jgi:hypothetical protein
MSVSRNRRVPEATTLCLPLGLPQGSPDRREARRGSLL